MQCRVVDTRAGEIEDERRNSVLQQFAVEWKEGDADVFVRTPDRGQNPKAD